MWTHVLAAAEEFPPATDYLRLSLFYLAERGPNWRNLTLLWEMLGQGVWYQALDSLPEPFAKSFRGNAVAPGLGLLV